MNAEENQLIDILQTYLRKENYQIDKNDFKLQLLSNPSFPSVKAITDTLDYFRIENVAANVPKDALFQLPNFFLAILNTGEDNSIAQVSRKKKFLKVYQDNGIKKKLSVADFKSLWNGTIIAIERKETQENSTISFFKNPVKLLMFFTAITMCIGLFNAEMTAIVFSCTSIIGLLLSYYIVREYLGLYNQVTAKICNSATSNTNCSDVVHSKSGKIFNHLSLSDISISYFASSIMVLSFFGYHSTFFWTTSLLSVPVIVYSIYTQAVSIKKWCPLCLGIAMILILQMIISTFFISYVEIDLLYFSKAIISFLSAYTLWLSIKSLIKKSFKLTQVQTEFLSFKRNDAIFNSLLNKDNLKSTETLLSKNEIVFGNPNAFDTIYAITNPLCGFCTKSFLVYNQLIKTYGENFKLKLLFSVAADDPKNQATQIAQQITFLYQKNPKEAYKALKDWYNNKNIDVWQSRYGIPEPNTDLSILQAHKKWCMENDIFHTPATILNDHFFPDEYDIEDLPLLMDSILQENEQKLKILS